MPDEAITQAINLSREMRETELQRLSAALKHLETEHDNARAVLETMLDPMAKSAYSTMLKINAGIAQNRQALSILIGLANHEQELIGTLVSQIENYRQSLGLPNGTREVGSSDWARHNRRLQLDKIQTRITRELAVLRARDARKIARNRQNTGGERKKGSTEDALLTHFQRRLFERFQITLSMQAIVQVNEFALEQPVMEVTRTGNGIKLLQINGQSVWALVTKSREGKPTLTTVFTLEMVAASTQQFGTAQRND